MRNIINMCINKNANDNTKQAFVIRNMDDKLARANFDIYMNANMDTGRAKQIIAANFHTSIEVRV